MSAQQTIGDDKEPERFTRALKVEIAKPLDTTWDAIGPVLRAQRSVAHRLANAAVFAAVEYDNRQRRGEQVGVFRASTKNPETRPGNPNPSTATYRECKQELEEIRDWAKQKLDAKPGEQRSTLELLAGDSLFSGLTLACIGQAAFAGFKKWKKDKSANRLPTWKLGMPIPIHNSQAELLLDASGKVLLHVCHGPDRWVTWALSAGRGSQWSRIRALALREGGRKMGDVKLKYDESERKWFAFISYSEPKPQAPDRCDPDHVMVLHRGQRNLLVAMTNRGQWNVVATGYKLRDFKERMGARRRSERGITKGERGSGANGHGSKRRYQTRDSLENRERDWVKTHLQQIAARVAELAVQWGCGTLLIEDYGGIQPDEDRALRRFLGRFPNYQLKECLAWSLAKAGLELGKYSPEFISQTCPACGRADASQHNTRTGVFHCSDPACKFERPVDMVAAVHALRRACGGGAGEWDRRWRTQHDQERKIVEAMRKPKAKKEKKEK